MVSSPGAGAAPMAQARRSMARFTAAALAARPMSAPAQKRHSVVCEARVWLPRRRSVASSASRERSERKSPPANWVSTTAR